MSEHANVIIESDGGSRGNPGPAGFGAVLKDADSGAALAEAAESIGHASNNVAEYRGLIAGLELYTEHTPHAYLEVRMDSKLVIEQMSGRWKVKHPDMRPLAIQAKRLAPFGVEWTWVPREQNTHADRLANLAMDAAARGEEYDVSGRPVSEGGGSANPPGDPTPQAVEPPSPGSAAEQRNPMLGWSGLLGTPTTLIFLRHGHTVHTADKKFSGPGGDDPGLNEEGRGEALRAAEALRSGDHVDAIVSSPMRRTRETADAVSSVLGLSVEIEEGFRECAFGKWDGHTLAEVGERWPQELDAWLESLAYRPPGGESIVEVQQRVEESLVKTVAAHAGQTVVVVSHVNPIKLSVRYCLGAPLEIVHRMQLAAGSLTTLSFYDSGATSLRQFSAVP
ncbi:MAG: bifunctional RNase H/acid phosphatase [Nocardioidaceae bacterium]